MRVLVATHQCNGTRRGDYDHCVEGELVYMQEPCASDLRDPNGPCGCGRGFAGMSSRRATSTALVADLELTEDDVTSAVRSSLEAGGWINPAWCPAELADQMVAEVLDLVHTVAAHFPVGTVVRRSNYQYYADDSAA